MPKPKRTPKKQKTSVATHLVIVESPTKTLSLSRYLGKEYTVLSSKGHIIDLPKSNLGVDVEHGYKPEYTPIRGKTTVIKELKKASKTASTVILATDLDREGEAIAWHIASSLGGLDENHHIADTNKFQRVVFAEITEDAIHEAFKHPRDFDYNLVDAYQARRILDRLVGYQLSPILWKKIQYGLSAGRVQSVAVRLIVEREQERSDFQSESYFRVFAQLKNQNNIFEAELREIDQKNIEIKETLNLFAGAYTYTRTELNTPAKTADLKKKLSNTKNLKVSKVESQIAEKRPSPPFTTATLQRAAATRLHASAKQTMRLAQSLYEEGYITYHRTDSTNLSEVFIKAAREMINEKFGNTYLPKTPRIYKTKQKRAQEAHEAIRPTKVNELEKTTSAIQAKFDTKTAQLYELIWRRAVASQATNAQYRNDRLNLIPENVATLSHQYLFVTSGSVVVFDGFTRISGTNHEDHIIPQLDEGQLVPLVEITSTEHQTSPPPRYNEASLVKDLEAHSIGRPSTYAPIIDTIQQRNYAYKENGYFVPADFGQVVTHLLVDHFPEIVDLNFTADMENQLDQIADGKRKWASTIDTFYKPFEKLLAQKEKEIERNDYKVIAELNEKCPECKKPLQLKLGRYGKFYSCSGFPDCKYAKPYVDAIGMKCPDCDGEVIIRRTKRGKIFYGCSLYPKCKWASWDDPRKTDQSKTRDDDSDKESLS